MSTGVMDKKQRFAKLVYDHCDLHFPQSKMSVFEKHLMDSLVRGGAADIDLYYGRLAGEPDALCEFIQALTVHETYFFRNEGQFRELHDTVFPELVARKNLDAVRLWGREELEPGSRRQAMKMKVWSAGCSTGEEAYSVALTLLDVLKYHRAWDVTVLGTDLSGRALEKARAGIYTKESFRGVLPEYAKAGITRTGEAAVVTGPARELVSFKEANLKELSRTGGVLTLKDGNGQSSLDTRGCFDVIFCRNVMIYFDRDGQKRLVGALSDSLAPGGYLFTGDSEPLHLFEHELERCGGDATLYYRKPLG